MTVSGGGGERRSFGVRPAAACAALACALLTACSGVNHRMRFSARPPAAVSDAGFSHPVDGTVSSPFGSRSLGRQGAFHEGVDFAGSVRSAPVFAAGDGRVTASRWSRGYGLWIEIRHRGGWATRYAHLSRRGVSQGQRVRRGEVIGQVGSTGRTTGAHLHFEVLRDGAPVDPLTVLPGGRGDDAPRTRPAPAGQHRRSASAGRGAGG